MRLLFIGLLTSLLPILTVAQQKDEQKIQAVIDQQVISWNKADIKSFMNTYWKSDSLRFVGKDGVTYGWQQVYENYLKHYPDTAHTGKLDIQLLHFTRLSDEYYNVVGKWHLTRSAGDVGGHFTLLFRKIDGEWKIVQDHTS